MSKPPVHTIIETAAFTAQASKVGVSQTELAAIYDQYAAEPAYGKVIRHTGGLRKAPTPAGVPVAITSPGSSVM